MERIETKRRKQEVKCKLAEHEQVEQSEILARLTMEVIKAKADKAVMASGYNATIKELNKKISETASLIQGGELREVEVDVTYDWDAGTKTIARADTGEVLQAHVPIEDWERQGELGVAK